MANRISDVGERRAAFVSSTFNPEARTIELTWSTGARVQRSSFMDGDFYEELSMDDGAIRLDRLNKGASLLNNHQSRDLSNILGVVERAWVQGGEGRAMVRFSSRADVAPILEDVVSGVIRNVSVGYKVHKWEESRSSGSELPTYRAVDWEPYELSLVGIPADAAAQTREQTLTPDAAPMSTFEKAGADPAANEMTADSVRSESVAVPAVDHSAELAEIKRELAAAKRETQIRQTCAAGGIDAAMADELVASGRSVQEASLEVVKVLEQRTTPAKGHFPVISPIQVTRDEGDTLTRGITDYINHRAKPASELSGEGKQFRGMRMMDLVREYLGSRGVNVRGASQNEIFDRAFHSTSDFPLLLADVANKNLLAGYAEEPQTWMPFASQQDLPDFKLSRDLQLQGRLVPEVLGEGGEYRQGTMVEAQATWSLQTFARKLLVSRQALINDDLGSFTRAPEMLGRGFRIHESDQIWGRITGNAVVGIDGVALFDAGHNNTGVGAIGITGINTGYVAMMAQLDIAGTELNIEPSFLMCAPAQRTTALQFLYPTGYAPAALTGAAATNPFAGGLQLIVENRLRAAAPVFYLAASPNRIEMIKYGYLSGEGGPTITTTEKRDPDGIELLARYDFGSTVSDFRGFYRSTGA